MRIVTYNIMLGGVRKSGDPAEIETPERLPKVMNVLNKLAPDVLGLQETLAGERKKSAQNCIVSEVQKEGNYPFQEVFDCSDDWAYGTGCALFSKRKPLSSQIIGEKVRAVEMVFAGETDDVSVVNVYLSHKEPSARLPQIKGILEELRGRKYCVIMGDFNALSREDKIPAKKMEKFNKRMKKKYFKDGKTCYDTINAVLDEGYIDVALIDNEASEVTDMTSLAKNNGSHNIPLRMDYFFVTKELEQYTSFKLYRDEFVQEASDHFPWEIILDDKLFK